MPKLKTNSIYLKKTDFDVKKLRDCLNREEIAAICAEHGFLRQSAFKYLSIDKKYKNIKVPSLFIEAAMKKIAARKENIKILSKEIENL